MFNSYIVDIAPALCEMNSARNEGQRNWVKVHAQRVGQRRLLCKVLYLQLSMLQRKTGHKILTKNSGAYNEGQERQIMVHT